ncbi:MAG TPA: helix-hairpin-helix domain-containing protein, partial [Candidatus Atribacteria bacterium]|nr:helix-hairpin-helix domain-containing protein [Candidatus Atribacteria bacterium]
NLASHLKDGQKIIIPYRIVGTTEEINSDDSYKNIDSIYTSSYSDKININTANSNLLQSLPGIGPVLSERIVEYRNKNGFFSSIDDIKDVSGIGEKKFEGIKDLICVQ